MRIGLFQFFYTLKPIWKLDLQCTPVLQHLRLRHMKKYDQWAEWKYKLGTFFSLRRTLLPAVPLSPPPACAHFLMTAFASDIIIIIVIIIIIMIITIINRALNSKPTFFALPNIPKPLRTLRRTKWWKVLETIDAKKLTFHHGTFVTLGEILFET